ncbi:MAG: pilus assembly protein [Marinosulfonomonas sp.]|nr:pilus assembly protein [Marinosulfonomonas sp.]
MIRLAKHFGSKIRSLRKREDGNATIEFAIMFPIMMTMFLSSVEIGILTIRQVMLERSVDMTIRDLRLGHFINPTQDALRTLICQRAGVIPSCMDSLLIELRPVSTTTWTPLSTDTTCKNRDEDINPVVTLDPGTVHEMVLVRVCAVFEPIFPTTSLGISLKRDALGGYALVTSSAFVNEPS